MTTHPSTQRNPKRKISQCLGIWVFSYWLLNRKNIRFPEIELDTTFCPFTTTGGVLTGVHTAAEPRFGEDCRVNPVALVGHARTTFPPETLIPRVGEGSERGTTLTLSKPKPMSKPSSRNPKEMGVWLRVAVTVNWKLVKFMVGESTQSTRLVPFQEAVNSLGVSPSESSQNENKYFAPGVVGMFCERKPRVPNGKAFTP